MSKEILTSHEQRVTDVEAMVRECPEIVGLQSYEYLDNDMPKQRADFIAGEVRVFTPQYSSLEPEKLKELGGKIQDSLVSLLSVEYSIKNLALYQAIEYRLSEVFMLSMASMINNPDIDGKERDEALEWYKDANEALYGAPKTEIFNAIAQKRVNRLIPIEGEAKLIHKELTELMGDIQASDFELPQLSEDTKERLNNLLHERFDDILRHIDNEKTYSIEEIRELYKEMLNNLGASDLGWEAEIIEDATSTSSSPHQKKIIISPNRKPMDCKGDRVKETALHEMLHILKAIYAERAGWLSATYGQDGYLAFEEGVTATLSGIYYGNLNEADDRHEDYYLVAGLSIGLDGKNPRDIRGVYEIMWRLLSLDSKYGTAGQNFEEKVAEAKIDASKRAERFFRGSTTGEPGVIYGKDLCYQDGKLLVWPMLEKVTTQDDLDRFLAGKLDLTRPDHYPIAEEILPYVRESRSKLATSSQ